MHRFRYIFVFLIVLHGCGYRPTDQSQSEVDVWNVTNPKWDTNAESEFSDWVETLGTARAQKKCSTLQSCLRNPEANTLFDSRDNRSNLFADCADVPLILRAYFAYKTKRPFIWMSSIYGGRYSAGNKPKGYSDQRRITNIEKLFRRIANTVHSGFFRMAPQVEGTDTYPVKIDKKSVRPGTVYYDPNGHVLIVYKVEENGIIRMIDGHPDNSLTVQLFGEKFARGGKNQGGGFRNFRPYSVDRNGKVNRKKNSEIKDFSTEQYQFETYHTDVRKRIARDLKIKPIQEFNEKLTQLCTDIEDRISSVNYAMNSSIHKKPHPNKLPRNIYGTTGEWETYSTPSRDARLKASIREQYQFINLITTPSTFEDLDYAGSLDDLKGDLQLEWDRALLSPNCRFNYTNSKGNSVELGLNQVVDRLFDLSFDPYHCPELRWGAPLDSNEFLSCPDNSLKLSWYKKENRLRNRIDREYGSPTPIDDGPLNPPDININELIKRLRNS